MSSTSKSGNPRIGQTLGWVDILAAQVDEMKEQVAAASANLATLEGQVAQEVDAPSIAP